MDFLTLIIFELHLITKKDLLHCVYSTIQMIKLCKIVTQWNFKTYQLLGFQIHQGHEYHPPI